MRLFILFLILFNSSWASENWRTNQDHSEILFQIPYLKLSEVTGRFEKFSGLMILDGGKPTEVKLSIDADSLNTGNKLRDSHLKGEDFLKSRQFPEIVFVAQEIKSQGEGFEASGRLSFIGKSHPLKIQFSLSNEVSDTWSKKSRFVKFNFILSRKELGLEWNKTLPGEEFLLGDKIRIWGSLQLQPIGQLTHSTKHMIPDTPYAREREKILRGEKAESDFSSSRTNKLPETSPAELPLVQKSAQSGAKDSRDSVLWWVAFGVLGLLGFFSTIIISVAFKKWIHQRTKKNHSETGPLGLLSDLFVILIVFIYAVSLWEVGWG